MVLAKGKGSFIFLNQLYESQVKKKTNSVGIDHVYIWEDGQDPYATFLAILLQEIPNLKKIAIDGKTPSFSSIPLINGLVSLKTGVKYILADPLFSALRKYKNNTEMANIERACELCNKALEWVIKKGEYWIGKTELELLNKLIEKMQALGLKNCGGIVATGENTAYPHYVTSNTKIKNNSPLLIDFGGTYHHYYSDMTRTIFFGDSTDDFKKIYSIVLEAHLAAEKIAKIGMEYEKIDEVARNYIKSKGYDSYFTHRTGHNIGLDVHEGDSLCAGNKEKLDEGNVFSIEPGIYLENKFGVRIENLFEIKNGRTLSLHSLTRNIIEIH